MGGWQIRQVNNNTHKHIRLRVFLAPFHKSLYSHHSSKCNIAQCMKKRFYLEHGGPRTFIQVLGNEIDLAKNERFI